ncbi:MAG: transporter substrate-binding domain-containing protein [Rhodoferax sp.]|nr:transporter substrate-binding domain-containing protein [Rhodoferax sp.]
MRAKFAATLMAGLVWNAFCMAAEPLRFSASSSWNMPYAKFEGDKLIGGIMFDLARSLEKQMATPVVFVVLPRKRLDAASIGGDIDLRCYLTPLWTQIPEQFTWSGRLFDITDVIFGAAAAQQPKDISDIPHGSKISTVLGYSYPALEANFANQQLRREDTIDQEKVMLKLSVGRTPYGTSDVLALDWYKRNTPRHRLSNWTLTFSRKDFQCGIPKAGNIAPARILSALEAIKKSGRIDEILRNYR